MIYYSDVARGTALDNILRLREIVASVPGNAISFGDAQDIGHYLGVLADAIRNERRGIEIERIKQNGQADRPQAKNPGKDTMKNSYTAPTESEAIKALNRMTVNPTSTTDVCIKVTVAIYGDILAKSEAEQTVYDALKADVPGVAFDIITRYCEANGIYGSISAARAYFIDHRKPGKGHFVVEGYVGASAGQEAEFIAPCVKYLLRNVEENAPVS